MNIEQIKNLSPKQILELHQLEIDSAEARGERRCKPVDCDDTPYGDESNELKAVVKLYKEAIKVVEGMTTKQLNEPKAFSFLIKIDKLVAKEFCLV